MSTDAPGVARDRIRVAAAVIHDGDRILLSQRPPGGPLGSLWEFPGGKLEPGETPAAAAERELEEELGVKATAGAVLAVERYDYDHGLEVEIVFIACKLETHEVRPGAAVHALRWVRPSDVNPADLLAADRGFLAALARKD